MDIEITQLKKSKANYRGNPSVQTGFPSPATHYREPRIDLNRELSSCNDATFFVRVKSNKWKPFNILKEDVLIIDRAATPSKGILVLATIEGDFEVVRSGAENEDTVTLWGVITYIIHKAV